MWPHESMSSQLCWAEGSQPMLTVLLLNGSVLAVSRSVLTGIHVHLCDSVAVGSLSKRVDLWFGNTRQIVHYLIILCFNYILWFCFCFLLQEEGATINVWTGFAVYILCVTKKMKITEPSLSCFMLFSLLAISMNNLNTFSSNNTKHSPVPGC